MTPEAWTQLINLAVGGVVVCWVAAALRRYGSVVAATGDTYNSETSPAMCHLLVVGFYLTSFGIVSLALSDGFSVHTIQDCIEALSGKLGWVVLIIGGIHVFMVSVFAGMGRPTNGKVRKMNTAEDSEVN